MPRILLFLLLLNFMPLFAEPLTYISGRMNALGGAHSADNRTFSSWFYNPASLALADDHTQFLDLGVSLAGQSLDMYNLIFKQEYKNLIPIDHGSFVLASLSGPLNTGLIRDGFAFRVYNDLDAFSFTPNLAVSSAVRIGNDLVFQGGTGFSLPWPSRWIGEAYWGFMVKSYLRWNYIYSKDMLSFFYSFSEPSLFLMNPMSLRTGLGLDLGFNYDLTSRFTASLTVHDMLSPYIEFDYDSVNDYGQSEGYASSSMALIPVFMSLGLRYTPRITDAVGFINRWDLYLDYRDILASAYGNPRNPILNLSFGTEARFFRFWDIRLGMGEGLMSIGTGLNFKYWGVGISMYGKELSEEPGVFSVYAAKLNIEFHK